MCRQAWDWDLVYQGTRSPPFGGDQYSNPSIFRSKRLLTNCGISFHLRTPLPPPNTCTTSLSDICEFFRLCQFPIMLTQPIPSPSADNLPPAVAELRVSFHPAPQIPQRRSRPTRYPVLTAFGPSTFPSFIHSPHPGTPYNPGLTITSPSPEDFTPPPNNPPEIAVIDVTEAFERDVSPARSILDRVGNPACPERFLTTGGGAGAEEERLSRNLFRHRGRGVRVVRAPSPEEFITPLPARDGSPRVTRHLGSETRRGRWIIEAGEGRDLEENEKEEEEKEKVTCCGLGRVSSQMVKRVKTAIKRARKPEEGKKKNRWSWDRVAVALP